MGKLNSKQQRFVEEYLIDLNATQAAIRSGYSPKTARAIGCENLAKPDIADAIAAAQEARSKRTLITADQVLRDLQDWGAEAKQAGDFGPAIRSRHLLGQHFKLFTEKHEHGGIGGGPVQFQITSAEADH